MSKFHYYTNYDKPIVDQIFVFGSNTAGIHGAGAARDAKRHYGAQFGIGSGLSGRSYAIPTKDNNIKTLPLSVIKRHIDDFIKFSYDKDSRFFFVTKVGCGLAGYNSEQIGPLFKQANINCLFHEDWKSYLE